MTGWRLKARSEGEKACFHFDKKSIFPANSVITIYSKIQGANMLEQNSYVIDKEWPRGKGLNVILLNRRKKVMASRISVIDEAPLVGDSGNQLAIGDVSDSVSACNVLAHIVSSHKTPIKIIEVAENGAFIRLENESIEDIKINGWRLKATSGGKETMFRFHTKNFFPAKSVVTIYSKDTGAKTEKPVQYYIKNYKWPGGKNPEVILMNKDDEVMASATTVIDEVSPSGDTDERVKEENRLTSGEEAPSRKRKADGSPVVIDN
ncbi:hypothetical protein PENTCL1PPCAC_5370 [Pristionchus entomophagus]|uniref:LTD domain-containing protein n=1 Tax=Pristionchus entomophagus TaxID=358040 RepID=A0AAV5SJU3_9BILA|nr:hypothetical protein PENTCL1PPCAC_5370 [Pristionchus entomophagus]